MAVRTITTRLALDGEAQFKQGMTSINASLREMKSGLTLLEAQFKGQANSVEALTAKDKLLRQEIEQQIAKVKALQQALQDAAQVYGEDSNQVSNYQTQLNRAQTELIGMSRALEENSKYLQEARDSADGTAKSIDQFGNSTKNAVDALAAALQAAGVAATLEEIKQALMDCLNASMQFESSMADFNKVAKLSDSDLSAMSESIKTMSTDIPATTQELSKVAEAARRLGVEQKSLLTFTSVMVNLGNVSDLSAEQAATALARFANVVGTSAANYERLGSVIVALGNNFATSESEITEMASRLASAGALAGLAEPEIMALAAAMSSVGIQAEAGGTAMTQTLTAMEKAVSSGGDKLEQFAKIAGMSAGEFASAWQTAPITAIQAFIAGLGDLDSRGESATQVLEKLGLSGIRQSNMLKSLALASETLAGTLDTADRAWQENTELAETAASKYDTTQAKMQMAANAANNLKIAVGDQLTPALSILEDVGADAFSWAEDFVRENPMVVSAMAGVLAGIGVMAAGFTVFAAKAALATIATTAWGSALLATPIGPIAGAIGVLVGAITAFSAAADRADSQAKSLAESMQANIDAISAQRTAAEEQRENVEFLAEQLEELAGKEQKTSAEKEKLLAITQQLNEAVPGLELSYDALNDTLSMTTDQILDLARAQADAQEKSDLAAAIVQAERDQAQAAKELEQAQIDLADAVERRNRAMEDGTYAGLGPEFTMDLDNEVWKYEEQVKSLEAAMAENETQIKEWEAALQELADAAKATGDSVEGASEQVDQSTETAQAAASALADLEEATLYAAGANDTLTSALDEMSSQGSLSLQTALDLIDAGYESAIAIDQETGAVTLNREEYIRLASAKIQAQLATLENKKAEVEAAAQHALTEAAATDEANAYHKLAQEKLAEKYADDAKALELQIAALNRAMSAMNSYGNSSSAAARRSSAASQKIKTQAEQDLEAYKQVKAELDHLKSVDLVDEAEYYRKMAEYRDQYLTDDANISEYRKVTEQIYKYDKSLADQEAELWADQTDVLVNELEERVKSVTDQQDKMEDRLKGYGDLFEVKDNSMTLNSIQEQIDAIDEYEKALNSLKERNISGGLMDEVLAMDVDSATQYANQLLSMSEDQWKQYNDKWDEKQQRAAQVAEQFFKDQMDALENEYNDKLGQALDNLTDTSFESGVDTAQGLIDGLASMEGALYEKAQAMSDRVASILGGAGRIPSNSELAASFSTERIADRFQGVTNAQLQSAVVGGVNALNSGAGTAVYPPVDVTLNIDGQTLARAQVDPMRQAFNERPETLDDT